MAIERYCTEKGCPGGDGCTNMWRRPDIPCPFEYVASAMAPQFRWLGDEPPPASWWVDGTKVYRSLADFHDD
jgi:hypothetical protein